MVICANKKRAKFFNQNPLIKKTGKVADMLPLFDDVKTATVPPLIEVSAAFEKFWSEYPRKSGKDAAKRKFDKALTKTTFETIMRAVAWQKWQPQWLKRVNGVHVFVPYPATWLHQGRYNDPMPQGFHLPPAAKAKIVPVTKQQIDDVLKLRASIDHQNHLDALARGEAYYRQKPWVTRTPPPPCPCFNCVELRECERSQS
jgi:hypothetical protein